MAIILDPSLLGAEGVGAHEANAAIVKINGTDVGQNSIVAITGSGVSSEGVNNNFALGNRGLVSFTDGVVVPNELTIRVYTAMAEILKGIISPLGRWLTDRFTITIQLDPPSGAFPGVSGLPAGAVLTTTITGCKITGTTLGIEAAGGAIVDEWTVKPLKILTPSGGGY